MTVMTVAPPPAARRPRVAPPRVLAPLPIVAAPPSAEASLVPMRLTVEQYHRMEEAGVFADDAYDNKIELIDGFVVHAICGDSVEEPTKMKPPHVQPIQALTRLVPRFDKYGCILRVQLPVTLPEFNEPLPDGAIVRGRDADYAGRHPGPGDILCLIEVTDASMWRDRGPKLRAYADAGVSVYVILNLPDRVAEVYTDPLPGKGRYGSSRTLSPRDKLALPTAAGEPLVVPVRRLLP